MIKSTRQWIRDTLIHNTNPQSSAFHPFIHSPSRPLYFAWLLFLLFLQLSAPCSPCPFPSLSPSDLVAPLWLAVQSTLIRLISWLQNERSAACWGTLIMTSISFEWSAKFQRFIQSILTLPNGSLSFKQDRSDNIEYHQLFVVTLYNVEF